ncbi:RNA polymerase sigma factor [Frankia sp. Cas3]|uniref:RNA polymerase sigma factor n=1 Tax=Frankia sp. Cas3 TaxID=3073926 RepID=UPI002AD36E73|nr:RNA polymerase sigma factor [Frankia sp. Cas3]
MTDRGDFDAFFGEDFPRLVLVLLKSGAGYHDAQDAAQEAMVALYRAWAGVDSPRPWVRTVALRIWWRRPPPHLGLGEHPGPPVGDNPLDVEEEKWRVVELMRCLPPAQRAVVALHYDGFSTKEIRTIIAGAGAVRSEATVRSSLRHGRRRLEAILASEGITMSGSAS